jgi:hypothetical protein
MPEQWENLLMVANCRQHWKEFADHQMYLCPATPDGFDPKYKQFRAQYFAPYVAKGAKYVAKIDAVVRMTSRSAGEVLWNNGDKSDEEMVERAKSQLELATSNRPPCLVYLLSGGKATDLVYDQTGALIASRQYFDVSSLQVESVGDLADKLREVPWSMLPKYSG